MKHTSALLLLLLSTLIYPLSTLHAEAFPTFGVDSVSSEFFREWYQSGDLRHYLDNYSDYVTYEAETTGEWGLPEQMVFSINGNSYRWNRLYLNGFRIDSRFQSGSTWYQLNMQEQSLFLNQHRGTIDFVTDSLRASKVWLSNNMGGLRGINPSTQWLINLFHQTASQRNQKGNDLSSRDYIKGAFQGEVTYGIPYQGKRLYQHAYANWGQRYINTFDQRGITGQYLAPYYKVQLDGELPLPKNSVIDRLNYYVIYQQRSDLYSEFMFSEQEVATQKTHSAALYGTFRTDDRSTLTTGLSYGLNNVRHNSPVFRNLVDQDGEGFEPWYADGKHNEINWAVNYRYQIRPWLHLHLDSYNSLMLFKPADYQLRSTTYMQDFNDLMAYAYSTIEWTSSAFAGGLLENQLTLEARHRFNNIVELQGQLAATFDGIILHEHSVVSPNYEMMVGLHLTPAKWFTMDVTLGNFRCRYSYEDMLYLSPDYLNGVVSYSPNGVPLDVYKTTGGAYHTPAKGLQQSSYALLDVPFRFNWDGPNTHHEFSLLTSFRLYYNQWTTQFAGSPNDYGYYDEGIYYYDTRQANYQVVNMQNSDLFPDHVLINNPFWLSNVAKYSLQSKHVFFSISWQSYWLTGVSALGNGPLQNNLNALSESTANPNILLNQENPGQYRMLGRLDQDRSFIARMQLGWNINDHWSLSVTGKFKDGTPFSSFAYARSGSQIALYNVTTKGINLIDNHFGRRKDAFFNFDIHARYRTLIKGVPFAVEATCYNVYDFGTELVEYTFESQLTGGLQRRAFQLNIPRGVILSLTVGLEKQK
ncbi:MAG: hypothetical protein E7074_10435 [Bacteroidales bacterium]|jgi:hypothetical protein|nr:hypothetical protein [Bacteroidales bacterium]